MKKNHKALSEKWIREHADEIRYSEELGDCHIDVYNNGFYTYTKDGRMSILRVDGCTKIHYMFATGESEPIEEEEYIDSPYVIALAANGERQWIINEQKRHVYRTKKSTDVEDKETVEAQSVPDFSDTLIETEYVKEMTPKLYAAMRELTEQQRRAVELRYFQEMSRADIARVMGISEESVKTHLSRALKKMRKDF